MRKRKGPRPDRRTAWREAATLSGGELVEGKRPSADNLVVDHGPWKIRLDTYTVSAGNARVTYTRAQASFSGWRGLRVKVRSRNVFDRVWQALGRGAPPRVGPALLRRYVVKGNPESRLPALFMRSGMSEALLSVSKVSLRVTRAPRGLRRRGGDDLGIVVCQTTGVVRDPERLSAMARIVGETLDALAGVGEARREEAPHP